MNLERCLRLSPRSKVTRPVTVCHLTLAHLPDDQRQELLEVLDRYASCFQDTPGFTDKVVHSIIVTPDFRSKRLSAYRVPEKLKPEVDKQLQEMDWVGLGIIRPSQSPMASPLVCVPKNDGGVRLAIDYRYLNVTQFRMNIWFLIYPACFRELETLKLCRCSMPNQAIGRHLSTLTTCG